MEHSSSTPVSITSTKVQRNFGEVIRRAYTGEEHFIVEKDGLPVVAIISMAEYQEYLTARDLLEKENRVRQFRQLAREIHEEIQRKGITEEEMLAELETTREEVFQSTYGDST